jgi:hypothetical protein
VAGEERDRGKRMEIVYRKVQLNRQWRNWRKIFIRSRAREDEPVRKGIKRSTKEKVATVRVQMGRSRGEKEKRKREDLSGE